MTQREGEPLIPWTPFPAEVTRMSARARAALALIAGPAATLALSAPALSGALDRTGQPIDPLFEPGGYVELSFGKAWPDVSATQVVPVPTARGIIPAGSGSGNLTDDFTTVAFAIKRDFTERVSGAVLYDQPFGADVSYPNQPYFAAGSSATVDSEAVTALLRYRLGGGFSVHGGLRFEAIEGSVRIPFVQAPAGPTAGQPYANEAERDEGLGYVAGFAYERPDIALRVALTYNSEIGHDLRTVETGPIPAVSTTTIELPQTVRLDFQSGVAPDTLVFGAIRWADWSDFDITPQSYLAVTGGPVVSYPEDVTTYSLGVGRRLTDRLSAAVSMSYEKQYDEFVTNLGPTAGLTSLGLGATYAFDRVEVTGAVQYTWLGDARTSLTDPATGARFQVAEAEDNNVVAVALQLAYRF